MPLGPRSAPEDRSSEVGPAPDVESEDAGYVHVRVLLSAPMAPFPNPVDRRYSQRGARGLRGGLATLELCARGVPNPETGLLLDMEGEFGASVGLAND